MSHILIGGGYAMLDAQPVAEILKRREPAPRRGADDYFPSLVVTTADGQGVLKFPGPSGLAAARQLAAVLTQGADELEAEMAQRAKTAEG